MDDARIREQSQSQKASLKRPWEEGNTPSEQGNARFSGLLLPVGEITHRNPSIPQSIDAGPMLSSPYGPGSSGHPVANKRPKIEGNEYNTFPRTSHDSNPRLPPHRQPPPPPPPPPINPMYRQNQNSTFLEPTFPSIQAAAGAPAETPETSILCRRCRRLASQDEDSDRYSTPVPNSCESCRNNPEYAWVTQTAANALTQLADTLSSGISSDRRGVIRRHRLYPSTSPDCPPLSQFGLKQTLNWILGRIDQINSIADDLVKQVPSTSLWSNKESFKDGIGPRDGTSNSMKRNVDVDLEESFRTRSEPESISDAKAHTRRRSSTNTSVAEELTQVNRPHLEYQLHGHPPRITFMNPPPPPAPTRQLLSPPGRSLTSPTSLSFPSPSTPFRAASQAVKLPPPLELHSSTTTNYLPPISVSHLSDTALRDHSASLQHEVSVQKIALSSLQGEHDKLLAAFSRSQLRASTLEKKHAVSDNEIISLSEEKLRLQEQIAELERDVEELSRSRDEFRQAAVQEGLQYVEIVKKASRLEEIASEERKTWKRFKEDVEGRIERLGIRNIETDTASVSNVVAHPRLIAEVATRIADEDTDIVTAASSMDFSHELKVEYSGDTSPVATRSHQPANQHESVEDLREEVHRLQARCNEVENTLRAVREDGHSMESILKALLEKTSSVQFD